MNLLGAPHSIEDFVERHHRAIQFRNVKLGNLNQPIHRLLRQLNASQVEVRIIRGGEHPELKGSIPNRDAGIPCLPKHLLGVFQSRSPDLPAEVVVAPGLGNELHNEAAHGLSPHENGILAAFICFPQPTVSKVGHKSRAST
ncbi:MAG: hypothetical protein MZW92_31215 [Comamonadaceae bacterium]|nr:hypothetical protein [Comamonadaceae bacterium]